MVSWKQVGWMQGMVLLSFGSQGSDGAQGVVFRKQVVFGGGSELRVVYYK